MLMQLCLKVALVLVWGWTIYLYLSAPIDINNNHIETLLWICGSGTLIFMIYERLQAGRFNWISILFFYLLSYIIVHFQIPILHVLGYEVVEGYFEFFTWGSKDIVNQAVGISTLGLLSFYIGYVLFSFKRKKKLSRKNNPALKYKNPSSLLFITIGSYVFYVLFFITSGSYKKGYYSAGDQMIISNYFISAFNLFLPGAIILKLYYINSLETTKLKFKDYILKFDFPITILTGWHILFSLFVGDRGPIIAFGLLYFGLYFFRWHKVKLLYIILSFFVVSTVFNIMGGVRTRGKGAAGIMERISDAASTADSRYTRQFGNVSIPLASTVELAFSVRCLNHSVWKVPAKEDYAYGSFQIQQILAVIPGAGYLYNKYMFGGDIKYDGSANYISALVQGNNITYGEGTVPTADFYLDFGVIGVIVGFFLFGIFVRKADSVLLYGHPIGLFFWISILIYFAGSIYLGRASLLYYLQRIAQIYFIILLNDFVLNTIQKR